MTVPDPRPDDDPPSGPPTDLPTDPDRPRGPGRARRLLRRAVPVAAVGTLAVALLTALSPWPGALAIRVLFAVGDRDVEQTLAQHRPDGVVSTLDVAYRPGDDEALLDVFVPQQAIDRGEALPVVVWVHGGAWVYGSKDPWAPYFQQLASRGYAVVAVGYSTAPEATYPTPLVQLDAALVHLQQHGAELGLDPSRVVLAGDSAGAQITSQYAAMVTDATLAGEVGVTPSLSAEALRGIILHCGIYDLPRFVDSGGVVGWGSRSAIWAYTGERSTDPAENPALAQMSTLLRASAAYPPAFISGGQDDPLTSAHSEPLAQRLSALGVPVTTLFFADGHVPSLGHEYQFDLALDDAWLALEQSATFVGEVTAP